MTVKDWASIGFLYEAIILTSNLGFSRWGEVLGDQGSRLPLRQETGELSPHVAQTARLSWLPRNRGALSGATRRDPVQ